MNTRLSSTLAAYAQRHDPDLLRHAPPDNAVIRHLANGLLGSGVLFLMAEIPNNNYHFLQQTWFDLYTELYRIMADALYPSFARATLRLTDPYSPPLAVMEAQSIPIISAIGGYIVPYIAIRQKMPELSQPELLGLLTVILDEIAGNDIPYPKRERLLAYSKRTIGQLLTLPIRHYCLTTMKKPLFQQASSLPLLPSDRMMPSDHQRPTPPPTLPEAPNTTPRPSTLPETGSAGQHPPENPRPAPPSWLDEDDDEDDNGWLPPVPPLPDHNT